MPTFPYRRVDEFLRFFGESRTHLARKLGIPQNTFNRYFCEEHSSKLCAHLWKIAELYPQLCKEWLFFGEGEMLAAAREGASVRQESEAVQQRLDDVERKLDAFVASSPSCAAVPLVGFARCGVVGWHGTMHLPVAVELPKLTPGMIAVVAGGDSMCPAGISNGQVCYCDPDRIPLQGEAVYVERRDGLTALKIFMGKNCMNDAGKEPISQTIFQGWLPAEDGELQKPYSLAVDDELIRLIAPVILVRRRL